MLTALESGVKGGRWHSLVDKVHSEANLFWSWVDVAHNRGAAGVDRVTVDAFAKRVPANLKRLSETLRNGTYRPQEIRRAWIPKLGSKEQRPLGIPTVRDRRHGRFVSGSARETDAARLVVPWRTDRPRRVQRAVVNVLEPIFERDFAATTLRAVPGYGFRPGRGCKDALRRVDQLVKRGYVHVVDADLKVFSFGLPTGRRGPCREGARQVPSRSERKNFDTIPHDRLLDRIAEKVSDGRVLSLVEAFLKQGVMDGLERRTPESGTPQGAVLSPLLSNAYLDPLDHLMAERGFEMVRRRGRFAEATFPVRGRSRRGSAFTTRTARGRADDFVILCRTAERAAAALELVRAWVETNGLTLHPEKTRVDADAEGFDFLGYHFRSEHRWPRKKSLAKLKATLRAKTRRTDGRSLRAIVADVNPVLRGWFAYFKHASVENVYDGLDGWLRMRLRSLLRKRHGGRGRGRGLDHFRWPNAFFREQGLYSLSAARALARQPSTR